MDWIEAQRRTENLVNCFVDIWQNFAEQGFIGKAPERGDAVASLSEGNAVEAWATRFD